MQLYSWDSERTKTRIPSAPPFQFSAFSSSNFCARVTYIEKMAPEESLYVVFSRKAGEKPGFWHEGSWGSCDCMSMRKIWGKELTVSVERVYSTVQHQYSTASSYTANQLYARHVPKKAKPHTEVSVLQHIARLGPSHGLRSHTLIDVSLVSMVSLLVCTRRLVGV